MIFIKKHNLDEQMIRTLYLDKKLSVIEISKLFGCSQGCISNFLRTHGIKTRSFSRIGIAPWNKGKKVKTNTGRTHFKKGLISWCTGKKLSSEHCKNLSESHKGYVMPESQKQKISESVKKSNHPLYNRHIILNCKICHKEFKVNLARYEQSKPRYCSTKCYGISKKDVASWNSGLKTGERTILECTYCSKSFERLSSKVKIDRNAYNFCSKKCELSFKTLENHPNWKGGISKEEYGIDFNKNLKEHIRYRDSYTCQECGVLESTLSHKLSIHHIDYNKHNNKPENLITLCVKCHTKTNYNRDDWIKYYKNKVKR